MLWSRTLTGLNQERDYFNQIADPDYIPGDTVLCYDCHTDGTPDNDPSDWGVDPQPQVTAFSDDGPGTILNNPDFVGYYELDDGNLPPDGTPPTNGAPTGGHYWKDEPTGTPDYKRGDKLACNICHDPHDEKTGVGINKNQAMFLESPPNGVGGTLAAVNNLDASTNSRNGSGNGRDMCARCHSYSDSGSPVTMWGVNLPEPSSMSAHEIANVKPCTDCHRHNFITASCTMCHGYPPPPPDSGYSGINETEGPHPMHAYSLADGGYGFICDFCHGAGAVTADHGQHLDGDYQDVPFLMERNPSPGWYNGTTSTCNDLYCHSRGTTIFDTENASGGTTIQWTDTPDWAPPDPDADLGCNACHGNTASAEGDTDYGSPGYVNGAPKTNSHSKHIYPCSYCHYNITRDSDPAGGWDFYVDAVAPENYGRGIHVNNTNTSFTYNVNPGPNPCDGNNPYFASYTYAATGGTCTNIDCHGGQPATWGDTINCTLCHYRNTAAGGDDDNFGFPAALNDCTVSQINSDEWMAEGHGRGSTWYEWPNRYGKGAPADFGNTGCVSTQASEPVSGTGCHSADVPHSTAANPYRLVTYDTTNYTFEYPSGTTPGSLDLFCQHCHSDAFDKTHSQAITGGDNWGDPAGADIVYKCVDCHDAHGDSPDFMIHANVFASSSDDTGDPDTTGLGILPAEPGAIIFDVPPGGGTPADYVDLSGGSVVKICQVCHQSNDYYTQDATSTHYATTDCMQCHKHKDGFAPSACEGCHSLTGTYPLAPNVMGDGTSTTGTGLPPLPYDDGSYGFNVNGHGIYDVICDDCHSLQGHHIDDVLNTYSYPGKADTTNTNTSHLDAVYFPAAVPLNDYEYQTTFDDTCFQATDCHPAGFGHHHESLVVRFGDHNTNANPKQDRSPDPFWTPWVARDHTTDLTTNFPASPYYGTCPSCHDPHGSSVGYQTGSNHMMRHDWSDADFFCNSICHKP